VVGDDTMSPGLWRQLIDIHTLPNPEINKSCVYSLVEAGLVYFWNSPVPGEDGRYQLTERGRYIMKMLCEVPLPIQKWIDPRTDFS